MRAITKLLTSIEFLIRILALLSLPFYALVFLLALLGVALKPLGWLPPGLAFITTDMFLVIAFSLFLWYMLLTAYAISKLQSSGMGSCCLDVALAVLTNGLSTFLLLAGAIVAVVLLRLVL